MTARIPRDSRQAPRPGLALLAAIASFWLATSAAPVRGDDPSRLESLDVFILVDVSRSMYLAPAQSKVEEMQAFDPAMDGRPAGSDPERQRWDAVRLLLDLLTDDDQVTILPFNEVAPAQVQAQGGQPFEVPGHVADSLRSPRWEQDRLGRSVEEFAAQPGDRPGLHQHRLRRDRDLLRLEGGPSESRVRIPRFLAQAGDLAPDRRR